MEVMNGSSNLNFQTSKNYVSNEFDGMAHMGKSIPNLLEVQVGKEDLVLPQSVVHNIEIIINNNNPATATSLSDVTTDLPKNNIDSSEATTNENITSVQLPPTPSPVVLSVNVDNQHLTNSLPTSQEFKFKLPNNPVVALSKTQLLVKNLNVSSKEEDVEPATKKFKGLNNDVNPKNIISPVRFTTPSLKKRKRKAQNKILSLKFRNDSSPDYVLSFIWKYWPEMIIANPHKDLSKRFLNRGVFACNPFNFANSNYIDCTAPYDEVLQVLSAEKYALQNKIITSQYYLTDSQYNDAVYQFQCLSDEQRKVYNAIKQVVKLYGSFKHPQCNFDARYINEDRFTQAVNVFPIIKSYEHFYGHA